MSFLLLTRFRSPTVHVYPSVGDALSALRTKHRYAVAATAWWPAGLLPGHMVPRRRFIVPSTHDADLSEGLPLFSEGELVATLWRVEENGVAREGK